MSEINFFAPETQEAQVSVTPLQDEASATCRGKALGELMNEINDPTKSPEERAELKRLIHETLRANRDRLRDSAAKIVEEREEQKKEQKRLQKEKIDAMKERMRYLTAKEVDGREG